MSSILKSTLNTRAILKNSLRFIRSDVPDKLSEEEIEFLLGNNVRTIVDLRTADEIKKRPCSLTENKNFTYLNLPVTGGNAVPESVDKVSLSYIRMADEQMKNIISKIENADTNVLYFCNAGKDRTGVVSAILLKRAGYSDEEIVDDYMISRDNLKDMLDSFAMSCPEVDINVITPSRRYIMEFLKWLNDSNFLKISEKT